jgi:citrate lyase subunit beta/citryl-CoA lyase/(S)-citramalyl-CoA lyase
LLFVPATRPSAFGKALDSGADIACVDLEDAVPPQEKNAARAEAVAFLSDCQPGDSPLRALRINAPNTRAGLKDVLALLEKPPATGLVVVPKVREAAELRSLDALLTEAGCTLGLAALIETLDGLENVSEIARACQRVTMLIFGAVDMSAELGVPNTASAMAYARARIVHAGRRFGLDVMDVPSLDFRNRDAVAEEAQAARVLGFTGKAAIHPATLAEINAAFTPSVEEIGYAERVIAAFQASPNGLAVLDGHLIEAPVVKAMEKVLAVARRIGLR